ncbi:F-box protein [Sporobolomyces koalae]|uniref:F-box protein n=1 Tax=Sporobolomyces koalae TaxID=500713 RepID=UPI0031817922
MMVGAGTAVERERPAKRPRSKEKRIRGKKGLLKAAQSLPVDMIFEICSHLDVADLLNISNTSKSFRRLVTGPASKGLFRDARAREGIPELLVPMTDLQYATLLFGKNCHLCGRKHAGKIDPMLRARICRTCTDNTLINVEAYAETEYKSDFNEFTTILTPMSMPQWDRGPCWHPGALKCRSKMLDEKFPYTAQIRYYRSSERHNPSAAALQVKATVDQDWEYMWSLQRAPKDAAVEDLPQPENDYQRFYLEHHLQSRLRLKASLGLTDDMGLLDWMKQHERSKEVANEKIRVERRRQIELRLKDAGFGAIEFEAPSFYNHPLVTFTRPLSGLTYPTKVEPKLREVLLANRRENTKERLAKQYPRMVEALPDGAYFPPVAVWLESPVIQEVIQDASAKPTEDIFLPTSVETEAVKYIASEIRLRCERLVRAIARAHSKLESSLMQHPLDLPSHGHNVPTRLEDLPLDLPRLPHWIPRDASEPIVACDEQLKTFLSTSPLARFECSRCRGLFATEELFKHFLSTGSRINDCGLWMSFLPPGTAREEWLLMETPQNRCEPDAALEARRRKPFARNSRNLAMANNSSDSSSDGDTSDDESIDSWWPVLEQSNGSFARIRMDADILNYALRLQQLVDKTPLAPLEGLTLFRVDVLKRLGIDPIVCFDRKINCPCFGNEHGGLDIQNFYAHFLEERGSCRLKVIFKLREDWDLIIPKLRASVY